MRKVAVITDTVSPGFWFPFWYRYYSKEFGPRNLHVVTYRGLGDQFGAFELGSLREIPHDYDDGLRARIVSEAVASLLTTHDVVLRTDTDEMLVADPARYPDLAAYAQSVTLPYVTARGFNIVQAKDEAPVDMHRPVLGVQCHWVHAHGPMNKPAMTRVALDWGEGFHFCDQPPQFDDLYLFHFKHADFEQLVLLNKYICAAMPASKLADTCAQHDRAFLLHHRLETFGYPRESGPNALIRDEFNRNFLAAISRNPQSGRYNGNHISEKMLIRVPEAFVGLV